MSQAGWNRCKKYSTLLHRTYMWRADDLLPSSSYSFCGLYARETCSLYVNQDKLVQPVMHIFANMATRYAKKKTHYLIEPYALG